MRNAAPFLLATILVCTIAVSARADRSVRSLGGEWLFRRAGTDSGWKTITLPASFEEHEGTDFDGVGVYKKRIEPFELPPGMRVVVHFQAVATLAEVSFNGQQVGTHLGGWTPFRVDVTEQVHNADPGATHELVVRVDEKVGHNSQGFMPVFAPHFGGIWQDVQLMIVPECWMDDLRLLAIGDPETGRIRLSVPMLGTRPEPTLRIEARYRLRGQSNWSEFTAADVRPWTDPMDKSHPGTARAGTVAIADIEIPVPDWKPWSPANPNLYELDVRLVETAAATTPAEPETLAKPVAPKILDRVSQRSAFRSLRTEGHKILLNDRPLVVRGLLNWGYAPPRVAPSIDEQHFRTELELARSYGFNLMKFCLWVPPQRYLELADEMGMLTWMEYPTWHSKWTPDQLPTLEREFTEFFSYDRNHPCVTLRSLTCETGTSAEVNVIRTLYNRCHAMIPGAIVEDDSSWISWNRVHDFYDDHPYGNNHTWVATLDRLKKYIAERTAKPLVLGEAIAADTWTQPSELLGIVGDERPFWLPRFLDGNQQWIDRMREVAGPGGLDKLVSESEHYALLMRKFQVEVYRREVPFGGYVVSVIRDIPLCSMGLIDYLGRPKWSQDDWSWHQSTMLLLQTPGDRRSFCGGRPLKAELAISHFAGDAVRNATMKVTLRDDHRGSSDIVASKTVSIPSPGLHYLEPLHIQLPEVKQPTRIVLEATLTGGKRQWSNHWPLWLVPRPERSASAIQLHDSCSPEVRKLFPAAEESDSKAETSHVIVCSTLDRQLVDQIVAGARVIVLPNGEQGSFPLEDQWFLRGAPYIAAHPLLERVPRKLLLELQHFDLAGPVIPDIKYAGQIDPILMLWNNHDLDGVKTQGLVFETKLGQGRLLVSALEHTAPTNAAGHWLARQLVDHVANGPAPVHALDKATINVMKARLDEQRIELVSRSWQFKPDAENQGLQRQWQLPGFVPDESWKPIRIGQAWEGQGYPALDGWAWYRIELQLPDSWRGQHVYVSFEGVDDYYELYVNGHKSGSGGDIATRTTAFEERTSHDVTAQVQPGEKLVIAVRVYDWYGAGGVFRPVTLSTVPIASGVEVLK